MKLSVIIPVYNRQHKVVKAARSVLSQACDDLELIIVDDASVPPFTSPDDLAGDKRVSVIRHSVNKGAGASRNTGIKNAIGKFIAFLDSDDVWRQGKLAAQLSDADELDRQNHKVPIAIVSGFRLKSAVTGKVRLLQPVSSNQLADFVSGCWFCPGSTLLINRKVYELIGEYDEQMRRLEDMDWFIRFAITGGAIHAVRGTFVDIEAGTKASAEEVGRSRKYMLEKYSPNNNNKLHLKSPYLRFLKSYLALEQAASHVAHKEFLRAMVYLAKSFWLKPRMHLHLKNWWQQ